MPGPFDPVGKKFRADKDYREAERQDYYVDCQNSARKERSSVENRDAGSRFPAPRPALILNRRKSSAAMQPKRQTMRIMFVTAADERRYTRRPERWSAIRPMIAGDSEKSVDSDGIDL
jgi:hypothetical protein